MHVAVLTREGEARAMRSHAIANADTILVAVGDAVFTLKPDGDSLSISACGDVGVGLDLEGSVTLYEPIKDIVP